MTRQKPNLQSQKLRLETKRAKLEAELKKLAIAEKQTRKRMSDEKTRLDNRRALLIGKLILAYIRRGHPIKNRIEPDMFRWLKGKIPTGLFKVDGEYARIPTHIIDNPEPADDLITSSGTW